MGTLFVVATPIGNLRDISQRALEVLREVELIACEDTRQTIKLLNHFGIEKPLTSYHEFNEQKKAEELAEKVAGNSKVAIVSDAGMPTISDPGYREVCIAREITKLHEEYLFGKLSDVRENLKTLGEFVIVVAGAKEITEARPLTREEALKKLGMTRNELYDLFFKKKGAD